MFDEVDELKHVYQPEDPEALSQLCSLAATTRWSRTRHISRPRIQALDAALRDRYTTCYRQYSLAVPFFGTDCVTRLQSGFTGQITGNSFMKREFGKRLIEDFLPRVDLTHVVDTSKIAMPGHGTSTVILVAKPTPC